MSFRFFRRVRLLPGVHLNLSRSGGSISAGPRGAKVTVGPRGTRATAGLPGTGMHWSTTVGGGGRDRGGRRGRPAAADAAPPPGPEGGEGLELSFLDRLLMPKSEERFVDGLRAWVRGDRAAAARHLERIAPSMPDAAFVAAGLAMEEGRGHDARRHLETALAGSRELGRRFRQHGIDAAFMIEVADGVAARATPDARGVRLALVEVLQAPPVADLEAAIAHARALVRDDPDDAAHRLSLAELLVERAEDPRAPAARRRRDLERVLELAARAENRSAIDAALLLQRGRAANLLGMPDAARDALTLALRRRKDRPAALLLAARVERAAAHLAAGGRAAARRDLERVVAEDPGFEDAAARLAALDAGG